MKHLVPLPLLGLLLVLLVAHAPAAGARQEDTAARLGPDFASAPLAQRRQRARSLLQRSGEVTFEELRAALGDPDAEVRESLLRALGDLELDDAVEAEARLEAIRSLAQDDPSAAVRLAAVKALGARRTEGAARTLWSLVRTLPPGERVLAAEQLAALREGRGLVAEALRGAFANRAGGAEVPAEVLAALLAAYARGLAETEDGGEVPVERAPLVLGGLHPDPAVRRAAEEALLAFLGRLRELDRDERADRMLTRLLEDGLPVRLLLFLRVRTILEEGGVDPGVALDRARELERSAAGRDGWVDLRWRARAAQLEACALLAQDRLDEVEAVLERAADRLDGLLEARRDLDGGLGGAEEQTDLLLERSLVELTRAFLRLARGDAPDDLALLELLRRAHRLQLEAQVVATAADAPRSDGPEPFFQSELSPFRLLFAAVPHPAWPPARRLAVAESLGRSLASVCPRELPGFAPFPDLPARVADPVEDPSRSALLDALALEELEALQRAYLDLRREVVLSVTDDPDTEAELALLGYRIWKMGEDSAKPLAERYLDLRRPAPLALWLAEGQRSGRETEACRELAKRFLEGLEADELPQRYPYAAGYAADAHLAIGGAWTDEGEGEQAEEEMLKGLELFEGMRADFVENDAPLAAAAVDLDIADALVSLAVNANVKLRDAEKALAYFERAYDLHQDDFMRIMLACYRARSGQAEEARELIRGIPVSPRGYYNLACTYALLGEKERALDLLERDLLEVHGSEAERERQKEWARTDPDLESLREDPRFRWLTGMEEDG